ncbi:MAG: hypothetical protein K9M54_11885 [Kiritimatiellales bacterium]|nr:hypothetical protein [Kiritimatiellales bacterium]
MWHGLPAHGHGQGARATAEALGSARSGDETAPTASLRIDKRLSHIHTPLHESGVFMIDGEYLEQLTSLHMNKAGGCASPHKARLRALEPYGPRMSSADKRPVGCAYETWRKYYWRNQRLLNSYRQPKALEEEFLENGGMREKTTRMRTERQHRQ